MAHCMFCYPQRLTGAAEVSCIEEQLNSRRNAFAGLHEENMEYEQNAEDYKRKLSERYTVKANTVEDVEHPMFGTIYSSRPLRCVYPYVSVLFPLVKKQ